MGRESDQAKHIRVELRFQRARPGPVYEELTREAAARGVTLSQHIQDLLQHRYNARHGAAYLEYLWLPITAPGPAEARQADAEEPPAGGRAAAKAWLKRQR